MIHKKYGQRTLAERFDHLVSVIGGERFLQMKGLNNDLPFYICDYKADEAVEMQRMQRQLVNRLGATSVACLGGRGVVVLEINLYDLSVDLLRARDGGEEGVSL